MSTHLVLDGDYSDPDVIRVGDTFWMITSTIHCSPGMAVLRSTDLRSWRHVGHCLPDLRVLGPAYEHAAMGSRFGRGVYAGSLRFHGGRFWMHFTTLDEGIFVTTADDPAGPWSPPHQLSAERSWDDPCPLWDDDGRAWLVASNPGPSRWFSYLIPMSADGLRLEMDQRRVVDDWHTSEGNKLYRRDGRYYLLHNEVRSPGDRVAVVLRADHLDGPWEKRVLLSGLGPDRAREPNQGALVDHPDGRWSFVTHHGRCGYPEGRPLSVLPVRWEDDWPVVSPESLTWSGGPPAGLDDGLQRDDDFAADRPGPQWEWTNAPVDEDWSLTERPGFLRLRGRPPARDDGLITAANVLSQRVAARPGVAEVSLDATGLADGTIAGLCHWSTRRPSGIGVQRRGETLRVVVLDGADVVTGPEVGGRVRLRTDIGPRAFATFAYRTDDETAGDADGDGDGDGDEQPYVPLGDSYRLEWSSYRGSRLGLFAFEPAPEPSAGRPGSRGPADFSDFTYRLDPG